MLFLNWRMRRRVQRGLAYISDMGLKVSDINLETMDIKNPDCCPLAQASKLSYGFATQTLGLTILQAWRCGFLPFTQRAARALQQEWLVRVSKV